MTPAPKQHLVKREATSIKIRPDIWKEAKIAAIRKDMDLSEVVEDALIEYLDIKVDELLEEEGKKK
jgi:hypothetical protein